MDIVSFVLFFLVVVPFILIYLGRKRKLDLEMLANQKETNKLLVELLTTMKKPS